MISWFSFEKGRGGSKGGRQVHRSSKGETITPASCDQRHLLCINRGSFECWLEPAACWIPATLLLVRERGRGNRDEYREWHLVTRSLSRVVSDGKLVVWAPSSRGDVGRMGPSGAPPFRLFCGTHGLQIFNAYSDTLKYQKQAMDQIEPRAHLLFTTAATKLCVTYPYHLRYPHLS